MKTRYVVTRPRDGGMGGFMNPPGHAEHVYAVIEFNVYGPRRERGSMSLSYAAGPETPYVPEHIKAHCRKLLADMPGQYTDQWERTVYSYFRNCYQDTERLEYGKPGTLIFPVPSYKLKPMMEQEHVDVGQEDWTPKYSDEYIQSVNYSRKLFNDSEIARAKSIAVPENHSAYLFIKKFFPEAKPRLDLIENPPDDYGKKSA